LSGRNAARINPRLLTAGLVFPSNQHGAIFRDLLSSGPAGVDSHGSSPYFRFTCPGCASAACVRRPRVYQPLPIPSANRHVDCGLGFGQSPALPPSLSPLIRSGYHGPGGRCRSLIPAPVARVCLHAALAQARPHLVSASRTGLTFVPHLSAGSGPFSTNPLSMPVPTASDADHRLTTSRRRALRDTKLLLAKIAETPTIPVAGQRLSLTPHYRRPRPAFVCRLPVGSAGTRGSVWPLGRLMAGVLAFSSCRADRAHPSRSCLVGSDREGIRPGGDRPGPLIDSPNSRDRVSQLIRDVAGQ